MSAEAEYDCYVCGLYFEADGPHALTQDPDGKPIFLHWPCMRRYALDQAIEKAVWAGTLGDADWATASCQASLAWSQIALAIPEK